MARETWIFFYWNLTRPRPENSGSGFFSGFSGFLDTQVCKTLSLKIIVIVHLDELDKTCTQLTCYNSVYLHWTFAFFPKKNLLDPLIGPLLDPLLDPFLLLSIGLLNHYWACYRTHSCWRTNFCYRTLECPRNPRKIPNPNYWKPENPRKWQCLSE